MSGIEVAQAVFRALLALFPLSKPGHAFRILHSDFEILTGWAIEERELSQRNELYDAWRAYTEAHDKLSNLLTTGAQDELSSEGLVRLDALCKSSIALHSMLHAAVTQGLASWRRRESWHFGTWRMIALLRDMTDRIDSECAVLQPPLAQHSFDKELRSSSVYRVRGKARAAVLLIEDVEHDLGQDPEPQPSESTECPASQNVASAGALRSVFPDVASVTSTFEARAESLRDDPYVDMVEKLLLINMEHGESRQFTALLDTGATLNCIAEADALLLRTETNTRKLQQTVKIRIGNDELVEVTHVMNCTWQFPDRSTSYTHRFHIVPGLPRSLVICRQVIFQHGFLTENIELCSLGLPKELKAAPELYVLGMAAQTKAKKEEQSQQAKAAMKANEAQRRQELEDMKQAFAKRAAAASSSSNASVSTQPSGSSSTQS